MKRVLIALLGIAVITGLGLAQSPVNIEITPDDPITVPSTPPGAWIDFTVSIENTTQEPVTFDAWIVVDLPWGASYEIVSPVEITLPAGFSFSKDLSLFMPWIAPEGEYNVVVNVGDYPDDVWDSDGLTVIKESFDGLAGVTGWKVKGDLSDAEVAPLQGNWTDSDVEIEITPDDPITIPEEGGWFEVGVSIANTTADDIWFDAWMDVELPWGTSFTLVSPVELFLPAGFSLEGSLWLYMPCFAPEGTYSLTAYVGDYPDDVWDQDNLTVIKEGMDAAKSNPLVLKGDLTFGEMKPGASPGTDSDVEIEITPDDPIVIPPEGDWFTVFVSVENTTEDWVWFDAWMEVELPWGISFEIVSPVELALPGGFYVDGELDLYMPWFAPDGTYTLNAYVGDYPDDIWDQDNLTVIKEASDGAFTGLEGWILKGTLEPEETIATAQTPQTFSVTGVYPNPFNPTTTLSYTLPEAAKVTLKVYNLEGALVATLVNGYRDAGAHEVTFDASALPSGMYFYRLQAGEFDAQGKMLLIK